ncbi:MAG TPA: VTT domain-containing protein [Prolixibacteraceae bacterium]|nr:VTT domain-containing protein [Prolixibacteraceae bacterium]HPR85545.1 VTT domain-containing protein [Prolixibacteraceae bacterium]
MNDPSFYLWLKHSIVIFFMTFLHEDAAILAAAFSKVEHGLPLVYAYVSIYLGIISGDIIIYGLGHFAQKNAWLRSKIIGPKVENVRKWLETNLVRVLLLCRITPGLLFPTYVACGWFKIPFSRFAFITILSGVIYSSIVLTAIILFGDLVLVHLDYWAWIVLIAVVVGFGLRNAFKPRWSKNTDHLMGDFPPSFFKVFKKQMPSIKRKFNGMPSLDGVKRFVSHAEKIPNSLFYIPVGLRWLALAVKYRSLTLPTVSNPMIETGGFWGESKSDIMGQVGEDQQAWLAEYVTLHRNGGGPQSDLEEALSMMDKKGLNFPVVVKPDVGWQGYGVRLVEDQDHLFQYISSYPAGEKMVLQRPVPHDGEAGIFYVRMPGEDHGKIISVTLRYFPYVYGDGVSTLEELIKNNPRSRLRAGFYLGEKSEHMPFEKEYLEMVPDDGELVRLSFIGSIRVGGLYRNASHLITPELTKCIDQIAISMPEFYFGRFDIRFESTELLKVGKGFSIIEINGAGSEAINAWDPEVPILQLYKELFKTQSMLFKVSDMNRSRGHKPMSVREFLKAARKQNKLIDSYPPAG